MDERAGHAQSPYFLCPRGSWPGPVLPGWSSLPGPRARVAALSPLVPQPSLAIRVCFGSCFLFQNSLLMQNLGGLLAPIETQAELVGGGGPARDSSLQPPEATCSG